MQENRGAGDCSDPNSLQSEGALTLSRPEDMAESTPRVCAAAVRRSGVRKEDRNGGTCAGEEESGSIVSQHRLNESVFDGNGNVAAGVTYVGVGAKRGRLCESRLRLWMWVWVWCRGCVRSNKFVRGWAFLIVLKKYIYIRIRIYIHTYVPLPCCLLRWVCVTLGVRIYVYTYTHICIYIYTAPNNLAPHAGVHMHVCVGVCVTF